MEYKEVEWEEETKDEESGGQLKDNCEKLKKDKNHHRRMIPVENVLQLMKKFDEGLEEYEFKKKDVVALKELAKDKKKLNDAALKIRDWKGDGNPLDGTGFQVLCSPNSADVFLKPDTHNADVRLPLYSEDNTTLISDYADSISLLDSAGAGLTSDSADANLTPNSADADLTPNSIDADLTPNSADANLTPNSVDADLTFTSADANLTPDADAADKHQHKQIIPMANVFQLTDAFDAGLKEYKLHKDDVIAVKEVAKYADKLKLAADAVVQIRVRKGDGKLHNGTGLLVQRPPSPPNSTAIAQTPDGTDTFTFAVMTNFHILKRVCGF